MAAAVATLERVDVAAHPDRGPVGGGGQGRLGEPGALGADEDGDPSAPEGRREVTDLHVGLRGEGHGGDVGRVQGIEPGRQHLAAHRGHGEDVAHRDPDRSPVEGVGAGGVEDDAADAERRRVAVEGAEVLVVVDPFGDHEGPAVEGELRRGELGAPLDRRQRAAMEVEPHDGTQHGLVGDTDVDLDGIEVRAQAFRRRREEQHRPDRPVADLEQSADGQDAFDDEVAAAAFDGSATGRIVERDVVGGQRVGRVVDGQVGRHRSGQRRRNGS